APPHLSHPSSDEWAPVEDLPFRDIRVGCIVAGQMRKSSEIDLITKLRLAGGKPLVTTRHDHKGPPHLDLRPTLLRQIDPHQPALGPMAGNPYLPLARLTRSPCQNPVIEPAWRKRL